MKITIKCPNKGFFGYCAIKAEWYLTYCLNKRESGKNNAMLFESEFEGVAYHIYIWHGQNCLFVEMEEKP